MDAELKGKWVQALRSGEFKQARGNLREGSAYCCLGVLCRIAGIKLADDGADHSNQCAVPENKHPYSPIYELVPAVTARELAQMNDNRRSFVEIAHHIEVNL